MIYRDEYADIIRLFEQARFDAGAIAREIAQMETISGTERSFLRQRVFEVLNALEQASKKLDIDISRRPK